MPWNIYFPQMQFHPLTSLMNLIPHRGCPHPDIILHTKFLNFWLSRLCSMHKSLFDGILMRNKRTVYTLALIILTKEAMKMIPSSDFKMSYLYNLLCLEKLYLSQKEQESVSKEFGQVLQFVDLLFPATHTCFLIICCAP